MIRLLPLTSANSLVRRLFAEYGTTHRRAYLLAFLCMGVAAACTALSAFIIGRVVNETYVYRSLTGVIVLSLATVVIFVVKGGASYLQALILARVSNQIVARIQEHSFQKILAQDLAFFAERPSAQFMNQVTIGATGAATALNLLVSAIGRDALSLLGLVIVMVAQEPLLSLIGLLVMPPSVLLVRHLARRSRAIVTTQIAGSSGILEVMQETIQGMPVVKAYGLETFLREKMRGYVTHVQGAANKLARVAHRASPLMEALGGIAIAAVFLYGGVRVVVSGATPGEFVSFITAFLLAYEPAKRLARLNLELNQALAGVEVVFGLLDAPDAEPADEARPSLQVGRGEIVFDNVTFAYRADQPAVAGLSFTAEAGKTTALVGASGGGKSTIHNLLLRLYEPQSGAIFVDGENIAEFSRRSVRQQIASVGQTPFLFRGSIRENIAVGRLSATTTEIEEAARKAGAHDFIVSFPQGYDTPVGEHGAQLSGGQRQRIAIARALLREAPIVLLDEITSSLDAESEQAVRQGVATLSAGRTTLVIAHRLHTIVEADRICVVEGGRVVEQGTHAELLQRGGRYAALYAVYLQQESDGGEAETVMPERFAARR